jgi:hypothetical protein
MSDFGSLEPEAQPHDVFEDRNLADALRYAFVELTMSNVVSSIEFLS